MPLGSAAAGRRLEGADEPAHSKGALIALIVLILLADQETKYLARVALKHQAPRHYSVLTLVYAENRGAFLSMGSNLPTHARTALFNGVVALGLLFALILLFRSRLRKRGDEVALALIIAGGSGNLIDRMRFDGRVTDFLYLAIGPLHTGVFNIADMAITFGVLWLLVSWGFGLRPKRSPW